MRSARPVHLDAAALERLTAWIDRYRLDAERSYRQLDALLAANDRHQHEKGNDEMTNPLNLNAPVDTLAMEFTRDFDAPVEALFRAHAEPDLVKQWLGPHDLEMTIEHWDFKTGGGYRYVHKADRGEFGSTACSTRCGRTNSSSRPSNSRARRTW